MAPATCIEKDSRRNPVVSSQKNGNRKKTGSFEWPERVRGV
jgi:hypothetical protein